VSFAGGNRSWRHVAARFERDAAESGLFSNICIFDDRSLTTHVGDIQSRYPFLFEIDSPGFGYWVWKPLIITHFLETFPETDQVLYLDAGSHFNLRKSARNRFRDYVDLAQKHGQMFMQVPYLRECDWTKPEVMDLLELSLKDRFTGQIIGGVHLWSNSDSSRKILNNWLDLMIAKQGWYLMEDSTQLSANGRQAQHRHDQSLLSCLVKSSGAFSIQDETDFFPNFEAGSSYPLWTVRNPTRFTFRKNTKVRLNLMRLDWVLAALERRLGFD